MSQKRRPEILRPSLKLLTPHEKKIVADEKNRIKEMWKSLYSRNKWKPQISAKNSLATSKNNDTLSNLD